MFQYMETATTFEPDLKENIAKSPVHDFGDTSSRYSISAGEIFPTNSIRSN